MRLAPKEQSWSRGQAEQRGSAKLQRVWAWSLTREVVLVVHGGVPGGGHQAHEALFNDAGVRARRWVTGRAMEKLNATLERDAVGILGAGPKNAAWKLRAEHRSPRWTTRCNFPQALGGTAEDDRGLGGEEFGSR